MWKKTIEKLEQKRAVGTGLPWTYGQIKDVRFMLILFDSF